MAFPQSLRRLYPLPQPPEGGIVPLFACRWPNGDVSFVLAANKHSAVGHLDEIANAEGCPLVRVDEFQVHFALSDDGELKLEGWGEATEEFIWDSLYPVLREARFRVGDRAGEHQDVVREAVRKERQRVRRRLVAQPATELGKDIKRVSDMATTTINRMIRQRATERLKKYDPRGKSH
jgi:hypothetical protein